MFKAEIIGNIVKDVELKVVSSGINVCELRVAVRTRKGEDTPFVNVVFFGKTALNVSRFFSKGDPILLGGSCVPENYNMKDGTSVKTIKIKGEWFEFLKSSNKRSEPGAYSSEPSADVNKDSSSVDEDLPFF